MDRNELDNFKSEVLSAIRNETHEAMQNTGKLWVKEAVFEIVPPAIEATFIKFGIDPSKPLQVQCDLAYLRQMRTRGDENLKIIRKSLLEKCVASMLLIASGGIGAWLILILG